MEYISKKVAAYGQFVLVFYSVEVTACVYTFAERKLQADTKGLMKQYRISSKDDFSGPHCMRIIYIFCVYSAFFAICL